MALMRLKRPAIRLQKLLSHIIVFTINIDDVCVFVPQGNMQRCKLVIDQVTEARDTMMKVLDHKEKVLKLLNKNGAVKKSSKLKRKERA